jgi:hypothetical protein
MEEHELSVWATCVEAVRALPGNPLHAVVDRSGPLPLVALCAVDRGDINRVIGLGVSRAARIGDLEAIRSFYESHDQRNFRIEVTPPARPSDLARWITDRGFASEGLGAFKVWRRTQSPPPVAPDIEVRRLGVDDIDAMTAVNVAAWGAWSMPVSMASWFGATVETPGVRHYGVFEAERLVATGALFIGDGLGWFGFDATHPRHQGRKLRQAISSVRMIDAAEQGCEIVHAEGAVAPGPRAQRDQWHLLYEKQVYSSVPVGVSVTVSGGSAPGAHRVLDRPSDHSSSR